MTIRFARWELSEDGFPSRSVLRLLDAESPLTDDGCADVFASPLAAAEAAWRFGGEPTGDAGWLDLASAALEGEVEGALRVSSHPRPRIVGSKLMSEGSVGWIAAGSFVGTDEWAMASAAGVGSAIPDGRARPQPGAISGPLSGEQTADWALVSLAGEAAGPPGPGGIPRVSLPDLAVQDDELLSGKSSGEWPFARSAGRGTPDGDAP